MNLLRCCGRWAVRSSVFGALLLTGLSCAHAQDSVTQKQAGSGNNKFDVDELFRRSIVIDGTVNYYSTATGSGIGQPDFSSDNQGRTVKQATGIDIGGITLSRLESLQAQAANLTTGRYQGAVLIRSAADIDEAVRTLMKPYGQKHMASYSMPSSIIRSMEVSKISSTGMTKVCALCSFSIRHAMRTRNLESGLAAVRRRMVV